MKSIISLVALLALTSARPTANPQKGVPVQRREVPQEHSHEKFLASVRNSLALNNPAKIVDPVFGLLGNGAAAAGAGTITNLDCLHQATADQAFTNAKAAGDIQAQADALLFAALERNTGSVGQASVLCTDAAVNPEIQALSQHQDPASAGAAAINKAITLELAKQLNAIGADPQLALEAGTFAPGTIGDPTAAGNTCDDLDDPVGCIFTKNLLVEDATVEEITAVVEGTGGEVAAPLANGTVAQPSAVTGSPAIGENGGACPAVTTITVDPPAAVTQPPAAGADGVACPASVAVTVNAPIATTVANEAAGNAANKASPAPSPIAATSRDFGSCPNPAIDFGLGFDGRQENSFQPADQSKFTHGSALNIGVITDFICNRLKDSCKASQDAISACALAKVGTQGKTGQAAADAFNTALGVGSSAGSVTPAQPVAVDTASTSSLVIATGTATTSLNFGSCSDPTIVFGLGFDGRQQNSFKPKSSEFNHGSALNIGVIASFICGQLKGQCKAAENAIAACTAAQSAAGSATGQAAADLFNDSLGFSSGTA